MSFVLWSPSISIMLNDSLTDCFKKDFKISGSISASVDIKANIVAIFGWIIPEPLAAPPITTSFPAILIDTAISFATVSVVIIALANEGPAAWSKWILPICCLTKAMGNSTPINPVLQTSIWFSGTFICLEARCAISSASFNPWSPTHVFAQPLFATTPIDLPLCTLDLVNVTDGETTLFVVNVPATEAGFSEAKIAISKASSENDLIPA